MKTPFCRAITLIPLRRPKGKVQIQLGPKEDPTDCFKDRAMWLLEALGAGYNHRAGYFLSPQWAAAFVKLYNGGWWASRRILISDRRVCTFSLGDDGHPHTLKEALKVCEERLVCPKCGASSSKVCIPCGCTFEDDEEFEAY